jgi:ABC-type antimicrobial peptide transport system ATPase subunit
VLHAGRLVEDGPTAEVLARPRAEDTAAGCAEFVRGAEPRDEPRALSMYT